MTASTDSTTGWSASTRPSNCTASARASGLLGRWRTRRHTTSHHSREAAEEEEAEDGRRNSAETRTLFGLPAFPSPQVNRSSCGCRDRTVAAARAAPSLPGAEEQNAFAKEDEHEKRRERGRASSAFKIATEQINSRFTDMKKAFRFVDTDNSGTLDRNEIRRAMDMWNIPIDDKTLDDLIAACDPDGDGQVVYNEFVDVLARDTVAPAALGKRGMQSKEAMGESAYKLLDEMIAGGPKKKAFDPSINATNLPVEPHESPGMAPPRPPPPPAASRGGGGAHASRPAPPRPPMPDANAPPRAVMKKYGSRAEMVEVRSQASDTQPCLRHKVQCSTHTPPIQVT